MMELKDLVGLHDFSGFDRETEKIDKGDYADSDAIYFILDGKTYKATEDPKDGYRSCMREIALSNREVKNRFPKIKVMGIMRGKNNYEENEVIDFHDVENGKEVLSIGTANINDYYPYWVADFIPENIHLNKGEMR